MADPTKGKLSNKQSAFVEEYLVDFNATQAAIRAGYAENSAASQGSLLLSNPKIEAALAGRMSDKAMAADEVLYRLASQARADISHFINDFGKLDIEKGIMAGFGHLVKSYRESAKGDVSITLVDSQAALAHIARILGLFIDKVEHTGADGTDVKITVKYDAAVANPTATKVVEE